MANYEHIRIYCGRFHTTLIKDKIYVLSACKLYRGVVSCKNIKSISSGYSHAFALTYIPDKVYIWGQNARGQLGLGDYKKRNLVKEFSLPYDIKSIECGLDYTIALSTLGNCYAWGDSAWGQLGLGSNINNPLSRKIYLSNIVSISCGGYHTIALTSDNKCYVWGRNDDGQLGLGHNDNQYIPQELNFDRICPERKISIKCGGDHTVALVDKRIFVWGDNSYAQLGLGDNQNQNSPQELILDNVNVVSIHCGRRHSIALTSEGKLYIWGENAVGQLGLGNTNYRTTPQFLILPESIRSVHCGWNHTVAITINDRIYGWGANNYKQLGDTEDVYVLIPTELTF